MLTCKKQQHLLRDFNHVYHFCGSPKTCSSPPDSGRRLMVSGSGSERGTTNMMSDALPACQKGTPVLEARLPSSSFPGPRTREPATVVPQGSGSPPNSRATNHGNHRYFHQVYRRVPAVRGARELLALPCLLAGIFWTRQRGPERRRSRKPGDISPAHGSDSSVLLLLLLLLDQKGCGR
ncbi:hypothetical protein D9C73_023936 [Collichthys lucidus]|uniref:Uncharacterized protein n=1 Tax=Collichthys lucidus TaxID=240159 RepID=A0A4U5VMN7_COLLU|nr:hypothetical protein D9C73_023936 [Collichthys lucidus]